MELQGFINTAMAACWQHLEVMFSDLCQIWSQEYHQLALNTEIFRYNNLLMRSGLFEEELLRLKNAIALGNKPGGSTVQISGYL